MSPSVPGQVRLREQAAQCRWLAVGQIDARRVRILLQIRQPLRTADSPMQELVGGKTVTGKAQGTVHHLAKTHGAVMGQHGQQGRDHTRHRRAEDPDGISPHVAR